MARALLWMFSDHNAAGSPRRMAMWMLGALVVVMFGLTGRLYSLQVVHNDHYLDLRTSNSIRTIIQPGTRGGIFTEDGVCLAQTTFSGASVVVNPRAVPGGERAVLANRLAALLGRDATAARALEEQLYERRNRYYYCVQYETPLDVVERVQESMKLGELPGVEIRNIETRRYPLGNFASQIVGFVGRDMEGLEGIERGLESWLAGQPGKRRIHVDALGNALAGLRDEVDPVIDGARVELTISSGIQAIVEEELREAVERWKPVGATIIVMETNTGALLGIANYPSFDPNERTTEAAARKNSAITDAFEPGSMIKPLIYAKAMEKGLINLDSLIEYTRDLSLPGRRKVITDGTNEIPDHQRIQEGGKDYVTVRTAIMRSSNTCVARVAMMLGIDNVYEAVNGVGFGRRTGFDMGGTRFGETAGFVRKREDWTEGNTLGSVSMGYEIQSSPMQMLVCFNSLANGGRVFKPYVVRRVTGPDGKVLHEAEPRLLVDSWMSESTSAALRPAIASVVSDEGTARLAQIPQYTVAGKTGTALKVKNGQYSTDKVCSFVGFAPADNPVISIIVVMDECSAVNVNQWGHRIRHYGGTVAAPTVARVVLRTLKHLGVPEQE